MSHWSTKIETTNCYVENGVIKNALTHEEIGYTAEYIQKAIQLSENPNVSYTRGFDTKGNSPKISFYGFGQKKDGTFWDYVSELGYFSYKLRFLIKKPSLAPLSPTEKA